MKLVEIKLVHRTPWTQRQAGAVHQQTLEKEYKQEFKKKWPREALPGTSGLADVHEPRSNRRARLDPIYITIESSTHECFIFCFCELPAQCRGVATCAVDEHRSLSCSGVSILCKGVHLSSVCTGEAQHVHFHDRTWTTHGAD